MSPKNKFYLLAISLIMLRVAVATPDDDSHGVAALDAMERSQMTVHLFGQGDEKR
jgi:hypothetical protein